MIKKASAFQQQVFMTIYIPLVIMQILLTTSAEFHSQATPSYFRAAAEAQIQKNNPH